MTDYRARADASARVLQRWYSPSAGLWSGAGWWNSACALTALIRYMRDTGDRAYLGVIDTTFRHAPRQATGCISRLFPFFAPRWRTGFINSFYDDNGWWALAWVAAHDLTGERRYLEAAEAVFRHNAGAWDDTCGGGLWWNDQRNYKNAITSELFLLLAAQLHQRAPGRGEYRGWALRTWQWLYGSGMIGPDGLFNDGLTAGCANNRGTTWTYNQGVVLGGLTALHEITGDAGYLSHAEGIAEAALRALTSPAGILTEPAESTPAGCNGDQTQFKGIFVRHLLDLQQRNGSPAYRTFLLANADSVWDRARNPAGQFGCRWGGPFDQADASRQSSALEVLSAAAALAGLPVAGIWLADLERLHLGRAGVEGIAQRNRAVLDTGHHRLHYLIGMAAQLVDRDPGRLAVAQDLVAAAAFDPGQRDDVAQVLVVVPLVVLIFAALDRAGLDDPGVLVAHR
jgi:predicted alpha-1,6-mannanase (GH76 family)